MKPLRDHVLIEELKDAERKVGSIIVPDAAAQHAPVRRGRVLAVGPDVEGMIAFQGFSVGSTVLFHGLWEVIDDDGKSRHLVRAGDVIAVCADLPQRQLQHDIFHLDEWSVFRGDAWESWKEYANIRHFTFRVQFLRCFLSLEVLQRAIYERLCAAMKATCTLDGHQIKIDKVTPDSTVAGIRIEDDVWDCAFAVRPDSLDLMKVDTNAENLCRTLPTLMGILADTLSTPEFQQVLGHTCNRVAFTNFIFNQHVRLIGKGKQGTQKVPNWQLMGNLVNLTTAAGTGASALQVLGPERESWGRIDLTVSFKKDIEGHVYNVFLTVQAPMNEESSLLSVEWQVQDHLPGVIVDRDYSPVFKTFYRDIVLSAFYQEWLKDVHCSTLGNK